MLLSFRSICSEASFLSCNTKPLHFGQPLLRNCFSHVYQLVSNFNHCNCWQTRPNKMFVDDDLVLCIRYNSVLYGCQTNRPKLAQKPRKFQRENKNRYCIIYLDGVEIISMNSAWFLVYNFWKLRYLRYFCWRNKIYKNLQTGNWESLWCIFICQYLSVYLSMILLKSCRNVKSLA